MQVEQTLRAAFAPCNPAAGFEDVVMKRVSAAAWRRSHTARRKPGRIIVFGGIVVAVAAAGILAYRMIQFPSLVAASSVVVTEANAVPAEPVTADPDATARPASLPVVAEGTAASTFTVLVQPLQFETVDPAAVASVQQYYGFLLEDLRAIPGLVLVVGEAPTDATVPADFRLSVTGRDAENTELLAGRARWQVVLKAERWQEDSFRTRLGLHSVGTLDLGSCPFAADLAVKMCMPSGVAAMNVQELRTILFPRDSTQQDEALARFRDTSLSVTEHNRALLALMSRLQRGSAPLDEDVIRGVLDVIAGSPSATQRASLWRQLRGQKHPALVQPLIDASRDEKDDMARLEAVTTLATDFSDAQAARSALDWVAGTDPKLLVRKIAQRALSGDAAWRDYVVASVKDTSLPVADRFEALDWMLGNRQADSTLQATMTAVAPGLLQGGTEPLAEVLVRARKEKVGSLSGLGSLAMLEFMSSTNLTGVPELLIACFDGIPDDLSLQFLAQHREDPRVRNKLEKIAAGDADEKLREQAAAYLE